MLSNSLFISSTKTPFPQFTTYSTWPSILLKGEHFYYNTDFWPLNQLGLYKHFFVHEVHGHFNLSQKINWSLFWQFWTEMSWDLRVHATHVTSWRMWNDSFLHLYSVVRTWASWCVFHWEAKIGRHFYHFCSKLTLI